MNYNIWSELEESAKNFHDVEKETLLHILKSNANTEYGKKYHFSDIHSIDEFKKMVPLTEYENYIGYIERMIKGKEENLILAEPLKYYVLSSGTTGIEKHIPITETGIQTYINYAYYCSYNCIETFYHGEVDNELLRKGKLFLINEVHFQNMDCGLKKGLISGSPFELHREKGDLDFSRYTSPEMVLFPEEQMDMQYLKVRFALACEEVVGISGAYVHQILYLMKYMENNWEMLVDDIENGTIHESVDISKEKRKELIKHIKKMPERAAELRKEFEQGFDTPIIPRIWKNIKFVMAISGEIFTKYMKMFQNYLGNIPYHYFVYGASEGIFSVAKEVNKPDEYVLASKNGYYEFLPLDAEDNQFTLDTCEAKDLEIGKKYELVYTGFSGFYRYCMGDIIEIKGYYYEAPIVRFCYRKKQMINIAGEKMDMGSIANVISAYEEYFEITINDFCIYLDEDTIPGRYIFLLEIVRNSKRDISYEDRTKKIDQLLKSANLDYEDCRKLQEIGKPIVHYLKEGTFERYKENLLKKGKEVGQYKPVRILDTDEKKNFFFREILEIPNN